jgi:hypothetical protein
MVLSQVKFLFVHSHKKDENQMDTSMLSTHTPVHSYEKVENIIYCVIPATKRQIKCVFFVSCRYKKYGCPKGLLQTYGVHKRD